jgi:hypothetical protein
MTGEGQPLWGALLMGGSCKLGTYKAPLQDNAKTFKTFSTLEQNLLQGGYLTSQPCTQFFQSDPTRSSYFSQLTAAVKSHVPYDGSKTTLDQKDAGVLDYEDPPSSIAAAAKYPVCASFTATSGIVAQAQTPGTDGYYSPYYRTNPAFTQGMILHESLHNLTGKNDKDLKIMLGLPTGGSITSDISFKLRDVGCTGN